MSYFPESIMPERRKDQTDVPGNPYVINAVDTNKHDEEIIAIESVLGVSNPNFPINYSGMSYPSGFSGFSGNPYSYSSVCSKTNLLQTLDDALAKIREIRNNMILTTSGVVCLTDPKVSGGIVPYGNGNIIFPTNWTSNYMTTLVTAMKDDNNAYDSKNPLPLLPYIQLGDVSDMPETGYISIINETAWTWSYVSPSWVLTIEYPRFASTISDLKIRRRNIAGTVEVIRYSGLDKSNNRILNVKRRQLGSTSTPHYAGDKVFKGRLSLQVSPSLYVYSTLYSADTYLLYKSIFFKLSNDGKIQGIQGLQVNNTLYYEYSNHTLYVSYQAQLIRNIDPMTVFDPLRKC